MLVCPKCQCKNPLNHKFCQKCGISLTQTVCSECGTQIEFSALTCHNCGAKTGKTWWGIMVPKTQAIAPQEEAPSENESTEVATKEMPTEELFAIDPASSEANDPGSEAENLDVLNAFEEEKDFQESEVVTATAKPEDEAAQIETESPTSTNEPVETLTGAAEVQGSETVVETREADVLLAQTPEMTENDEPVETLTGAAVVQESEADISIAQTPETTENPETITADRSVAFGNYLDDRQRYQLIELMEQKTDSGELQGSVLDSEPLQISPLLTSVSASQGSSRSGSTTMIQSSMLPPAIAEPYLQLRSQWSPAIPLIHDAWENQDYSILLIEERSEFPRLIDRCHQSEELEPLNFQQILQWFKEMTELWQVLTSWKCRQSLLNIDNLLVDPVSGGLRLQRLYSDRADSVPLSELGKVWQQLLPPEFFPPEENEPNIEPSSYPELIQLVNEVVNQEILTSDKLLATIQAIAHPPEDDEDFNEDDDISTVMMTQGLSNLEAAGATDVGRQRSHNEDDFAIDTKISQRETSQNRTHQFRGLYIVCDGMGGHDGGEVASAVAVENLQQYFATHWQDRLMLPDEATIGQGILSANQAIYDHNQKEDRSGSGRMGTTLVMAVVNNNQMAVAHVGDSRFYRLSQSKGLEQITVDHEVGQREIQRGIDPEIAYSRPDAYQLTQALGPRPENFVKPDIQLVPIEEDSLFILASDGLTDNDLLENHISTHLEPLLNSQADLNQGVKELIALANDYNGHDNITAIIIRARVLH